MHALRRLSLKNATEDLHRELDDRVAALDLAEPEHYRLFLQASAAALIPIEAMLERSGVQQLLPDWDRRSRRAALLHDLQRFDAQPDALQLNRGAPSPGEMFGMLYVLEGSRMDARVLLDRAQSAVDPRIREASAFLGASDPALWRSFVDRLESSEQAADQQLTTAGAIYTFALFQRSFEQKLPPAPMH